MEGARGSTGAVDEIDEGRYLPASSGTFDVEKLNGADLHPQAASAACAAGAAEVRVAFLTRKMVGNDILDTAVH
jgi:hypothetical protein